MRIRPRPRRQPRPEAAAAPLGRSGVAFAIAALLAVGPLGASLFPGVSRVAAATRLADETAAPLPPPITVDLQVAGGYRTDPATDFGTAVSVPNGTYVTFRGTVAPAAPDLPVEFHQRIGKSGDWTFLSTGRTDPSGTVVWSRVVRVPDEATGYDRYVYFRVSVPDPATAGAVTSKEVLAVASADAAVPFLIPAPGTVWEDGVATWYCLPGRSPCTVGHPADGMYAAISPAYGIPPDSSVSICRQDRCVTVTVIDKCAAGPRCVDLYAGAFALLAPLSTGRIAVTVQLLGPDGQTPPDVPPTTPPVTVDLRVAGGHRTNLVTDYTAASYVPNGTYVTLRVTVAPAAPDLPVAFHQRVGKSGDWAFLSTGRTDASGTAVWSRVVRVPAEATGYDRYVYFRVSVPGAADGSPAWSNAVRGVAR